MPRRQECLFTTRRLRHYRRVATPTSLSARAMPPRDETLRVARNTDAASRRADVPSAVAALFIDHAQHVTRYCKQCRKHRHERFRRGDAARPLSSPRCSKAAATRVASAQNITPSAFDMRAMPQDDAATMSSRRRCNDATRVHVQHTRKDYTFSPTLPRLTFSPRVTARRRRCCATRRYTPMPDAIEHAH